MVESVVSPPRPIHITAVAVLFGLLALWLIIEGFVYVVQGEPAGDATLDLGLGIFFGAASYGLMNRKRWCLYLIWPVLIIFVLNSILFFVNHGLSGFTVFRLVFAACAFYTGWALFRAHKDGYFRSDPSPETGASSE